MGEKLTGIKNMPKKRAGVLSVATQMTLPASETILRHAMWMLRSPVRPDE